MAKEQKEFDEDVLKFLEIIKQTRKEKGITQEQMAEHLGIAQPSYRDIESAKVRVKAAQIFQMIRFLDIDLSSGIPNDKEETYLPAKIETFEDMLELLPSLATKEDNKKLEEKLDQIIKLLNREDNTEEN